MNSTYIIIPAVDDAPLIIGQVPVNEVGQFAANHVGDPQIFSSEKRGLTLTFDSTAREFNLPLNQRAMQIVWSQVDMGFNSSIHGGAVLTGFIRLDGSADSLSEETVHLLTEATNLKVQVKEVPVRNRPDPVNFDVEWRTLEGRYDNWFTACSAALKYEWDSDDLIVDVRFVQA